MNTNTINAVENTITLYTVENTSSVNTEVNAAKSEKKKRTKKIVETCSICTEKLNKSTRLNLNCPYCDHAACRECYKRWVLMETRPHCMNNDCNVEWTSKHMVQLFPYTFIKNEYKKHQENVLFDRERALMPATQLIIEQMIAREHKEEEINNVFKDIRVLYNKIEDLRRELARNMMEPNKKTERATFVRACPEENCRGFLSTQWKCGICEKWTCPHCHVVKGLEREVEHTCDQNDLATATLLSNDTRPCPSCGTGIFKISGCDQMFCVECHTGFNWRTGSIETNIHNPHYFEWLRRTGGNDHNDRNQTAAMNNCNEITSTFFRNILSKIRSITISYGINTNDLSKRVSDICQAMIHINRVVMNQYRTNQATDNQSLRIKFMRNLMTEYEFKEKLQRQEKKMKKYRACYDVFQLLCNTTTDIMFRFDQKLRDDTELFRDMETKHNKNVLNNIVAILDEVNTIVNYANECFAEISMVYQSQPIVLNKTGRPM